MKYAAVCCVLIVLSTFGVAWAQNPEEIVVTFFDGGYPPFYMAGLKEGMVIDFLKAFEQSYPEFKIVPRALSRKRIDLMLLEGEAQASGLTNPMFVDPATIDQFVFTIPLWKSGNYMIFNANNVFEYTKPEDLFDRRLGVIQGNKNSGFDEFIEAGRIKTVAVSSNVQLCKILQAGRVDAIIGNKHVIPYEIKQGGLDRSQFVFLEPALFEFDLMVQVRKSHQHLADKLNEFIEQSKENGFLDQITDKYLK